MRFTKMHGIGNDYVYVDCFAEQLAGRPGEDWPSPSATGTSASAPTASS